MYYLIARYMNGTGASKASCPACDDLVVMKQKWTKGINIVVMEECFYSTEPLDEKINGTKNSYKSNTNSHWKKMFQPCI